MAEAPAGEPSVAGQRRASQEGAASGSHLQPPVSPLPEDGKRWPSLQDFCQSITRKASPRRRTDPLVSFCDLLRSPGSSVSVRPRTRHSRRARAAGGTPVRGSGRGVQAGGRVPSPRAARGSERGALAGLGPRFRCRGLGRFPCGRGAGLAGPRVAGPCGPRRPRVRGLQPSRRGGSARWPVWRTRRLQPGETFAR